MQLLQNRSYMIPEIYYFYGGLKGFAAVVHIGSTTIYLN
jgi:hypothetical protein